ncbi:MAG: NUDIX hydrolase [Asticcacaulis sp.]
MGDFGGAKMAILHKDQLLVYLRDDKPDIPFPALWDFPGGGREGDETPHQCAVRETFEEFGLHIAEAAIVWEQAYPSASGGLPTWFLVARLDAPFEGIRFGDEGQRWEVMSVDAYLRHPQAIGYLKARLSAYLDGRD